MSDWENRVPRLHHSLTNIKGQSIFWMEKSEWKKIQKDCTSPVHIVIDDLKLPITFPEKTLGAFYSGKYIEIYRNDPTDYPYTRNVDRYEAIESIDKDLLEKAIIKGSTSDNTNLRDFLEEYIVLVKIDHRETLSFKPDEIPKSISLYFKST